MSFCVGERTLSTLAWCATRVVSRVGDGARIKSLPHLFQIVGESARASFEACVARLLRRKEELDESAKDLVQSDRELSSGRRADVQAFAKRVPAQASHWDQANAVAGSEGLSRWTRLVSHLLHRSEAKSVAKCAAEVYAQDKREQRRLFQAYEHAFAVAGGKFDSSHGRANAEEPYRRTDTAHEGTGREWKHTSSGRSDSQRPASHDEGLRNVPTDGEQDDSRPTTAPEPVYMLSGSRSALRPSSSSAEVLTVLPRKSARADELGNLSEVSELGAEGRDEKDEKGVLNLEERLPDRLRKEVMQVRHQASKEADALHENFRNEVEALNRYWKSKLSRKRNLHPSDVESRKLTSADSRASSAHQRKNLESSSTAGGNQSAAGGTSRRSTPRGKQQAQRSEAAKPDRTDHGRRRRRMADSPRVGSLSKEFGKSNSSEKVSSHAPSPRQEKKPTAPQEEGPKRYSSLHEATSKSESDERSTVFTETSGAGKSVISRKERAKLVPASSTSEHRRETDAINEEKLNEEVSHDDEVGLTSPARLENKDDLHSHPASAWVNSERGNFDEVNRPREGGGMRNLLLFGVGVMP